VLKVCRTPGPIKDAIYDVFEKLKKGEKFHPKVHVTVSWVRLLVYINIELFTYIEEYTIPQLTSIGGYVICMVILDSRRYCNLWNDSLQQVNDP